VFTSSTYAMMCFDCHMGLSGQNSASFPYICEIARSIAWSICVESIRSLDQSHIIVLSLCYDKTVVSRNSRV
jgi:hypothetical protein